MRFLKTTWRNLARDPQFTQINLLGLSIGLACTLMIYLWVNDELSIDTFNEKDDQLYQVMKTSIGSDGVEDTYEGTPALLAGMMADQMPEIECATAAFKFRGRGIVGIADKQFKTHVQYVDTNYFKLFSYQLLQGNKHKILRSNKEVLISDKLAFKLFNTTENTIGKTINWYHSEQLNGPFTIAGVFKAPPANASVQFDLLFSYDLYFEAFKEYWGLSNWGINSAATYVLLKKGVDVAAFNDKIKEYNREQFKAQYGTAGLQAEGRIFLQRYSHRYLYNRYKNDGVQSAGRIEYVRLFSIIAIFILLIACVNFMNLSTAKAFRRMKELGIKKIVGAGKGSLILQCLAESTIMAFLALLIAGLIVAFLFPGFKAITGKEISLHFSTSIIFSVLGITLLTGLIAGGYPAVYLSSFQPLAVLKGNVVASGKELWTRKGLVVFQFTISVVLIIAVMVVFKQTQYIHSKNLGYSKDHILRFKNEGKIKDHFSSFIAELKNTRGVFNASSMSGDMLGNTGGGDGLIWPGKPAGKGLKFSGIDIGHDAMEMFDLKLTAGRKFSPQFGAETEKVIFNETAIAAMNLKNPLGQVVEMWGVKREIIGIVEDFHFESLYNQVGPFYLTFLPANDDVVVKIKAGNEKETLARIEALFKRYNLGLPFEYTFMDDDYRQLYVAEERIAVLSRYFAGIAILISCLGLFGLSTFSVQKRQKEIGIRKVLGASIIGVTNLLAKDFLKLVLIAIVLATPVSWYLMDRWLADFAYRIQLQWWMFVLAGLLAVVIAFLTISFQSVKAALMNPVNSLRSE